MYKYLIGTALVLSCVPAHAQDEQTARTFAILVGVNAACKSELLPDNLSTQLDLMSLGVLQGYAIHYYESLDDAHNKGEADGRKLAAEVGCAMAAKQVIAAVAENMVRLFEQNPSD